MITTEELVEERSKYFSSSGERDLDMPVCRAIKTIEALSKGDVTDWHLEQISYEDISECFPDYSFRDEGTFMLGPDYKIDRIKKVAFKEDRGQLDIWLEIMASKEES